MQNELDTQEDKASNFQNISDQSICIGIDIGGTNTDGVALIDDAILAVAKVGTTFPFTQGIKTVIVQLINAINYRPEQIKSVIVGTTSFINAVLQAKELNKVLTIRIGRPATTAVEPFFDWPSDLKNIINIHDEIIFGGHEYDGKEISPLNHKKLVELATMTKIKNIKFVAITSVFANANPEHEKIAAKILLDNNPALQITLSHEIGGINLLLRENAAILNAALSEYFINFTSNIKEVLVQLNLHHASLFFSLNDGTLDKPQCIFPVSTYCSGQSNSIRGASLLTKHANAIVVDIGGTSTDVGILRNGYPLEAGTEIKIGNAEEGVSCNFNAPLTRSYGLGGGSIIIKNAKGEIKVGPLSVGFQLRNKSLSFGGDTLTITDIAVAKRRIIFGDSAKLKSFDSAFIEHVDVIIHKKLADIINSTLPFLQETGPVVLILVGGGALLFDEEKLLSYIDAQIKQIQIPQYAGFANALGAACAKISGVYHGVCQYSDNPVTGETTRVEAIKIATQIAIQNAIDKGAKANTLIVQQIEETPINYVPGNRTLLRLKVVGEFNKQFAITNSKKITHNQKCLLLSDSPINIDHEERIVVSNANILHSVQFENNSSQHSNKADVKNISKILSSGNSEYFFTQEDIKDIALGTGILGSGGGGSTKLCEVINIELIKKGIKIQMIPIEEVNNEALVVAVGVMGAPTVLAEKLPSKEESIRVIESLENYLAKKIDYLIAMEIGGMNGLYAMYIAAQSKKKIIDGDCMGRAFPEIQMVTPNMYSKIEQCVAVVANGQTTAILSANNLKNLEIIARQKTIEMGGIVTLGYLPMPGRDVKRYCVPHSISVAKAIGRHIRAAQKTLYVNAINNALDDTEYGPAEIIISGKIIDLHRYFDKGFNRGYALIKDPIHNAVVKIEFQNENLLVTDLSENRIIAQVPTIITLLDNELKPISCEALRMCLEVTVFALKAPKILCTEKALNIIGYSSNN